ncbi:MAG: hypothetical protein WC544_00265 [Patescibacteria group bacterium]
MAHKIEVRPSTSGAGWDIVLNGTPVKSITNGIAPVITKSDAFGVSFQHGGKTHRISWPN